MTEEHRTLVSLAERLPAAFSALTTTAPTARHQIGWIALDIAKALVWQAGNVGALGAAANELRRYALAVLGEPGFAVPPKAMCPLAERVARMEALWKAGEVRP